MFFLYSCSHQPLRQMENMNREELIADLKREAKVHDFKSNFIEGSYRRIDFIEVNDLGIIEHTTLVDVPNNKKPLPKQFINQLGKFDQDDYCNESVYQRLRERDVSITHKYSAVNGDFLVEISINKNDCNDVIKNKKR